MNEHAAEPGQDDPVLVDPAEFVGEPPAGDATPGEYMSNDQQGGVSRDTGTTYDPEGEPETTPQEENPADDEGDPS